MVGTGAVWKDRRDSSGLSAPEDWALQFLRWNAAESAAWVNGQGEPHRESHWGVTSQKGSGSSHGWKHCLRSAERHCKQWLGKDQELLKGLEEHCLVVFTFSWWLDHCEEVIEAENKISGLTDPWVSVLKVVSSLWWWMGL